MLNGHIEQFVQSSILKQKLPSLLRDADSVVTQSVALALQNLPGFRSPTSQQIARYFGGTTTTAAPVTEAQPAQSVVPSTPLKSDGSAVATSNAKPPAYGLRELESQSSTLVTGRRPTRVYLPDNTTYQVSSWAGLTLKVVAFLGSQKRLPVLPYRGKTKGKDYFLNTEPMHQVKGMRDPKSVALENSTIYVETNRSSTEVVRMLSDLCEGVGVSAESIRIEIADL